MNTATKIFTNTTLELYKPKLIQFESLDILHKKFIEWMADKTIDISGEHGTARIGLSSSVSLNEIYKLIGKNYSFPFEEVELFQTDESYSSQESQSSITRLLTNSNLELSKYNNFIVCEDGKDTSTRKYMDILDQFDYDEGFDICVLEIKKDGSIAGLIANGNGMTGNSETVVINNDNITISAPMILRSKEIVCVLVDGNDILEEMMEGQKSATEFSSKILLAHPNVTIFYYLDI